MSEEKEGKMLGNVETYENILDKTNPLRKNVIKAIDSEVTHRICSGQVIVTLSTAVKELVENSLDAGAKSIEIRLVEYGSKVIEVKDNGSGVEESNFSGLALKHHTSKLSQFEDLESIGTFGFRGEALSSLCALGNLSVTTRHEESNQGFRIDYDAKGQIQNQFTVARQVGTTVTLKDIFSTLPVRHKEFLKNSKREFNKMVNVLYGYCFVTTGVRISCTNELKSSNGLPSKVICVPASETTKERIAHIFGAKQLALLVDIDETDETDELYLNEFGLNRSSFEESRFRLSGVISGPNCGRSAADRQFFFVNSRPCESPKISRLVNEVYHAFSRSQYPFICLNMTTTQEDVDVNVTPDKRTLYLQNEKILFAKLKGALMKTLTKASCNFSPSQLTLHQSTLTFSPSSSSQVSLDDDDVMVVDEGYNLSPESNYSPSMPIHSLGCDTQNSGFLNRRPDDAKNQRENVRSFLSKFKFGSNANVIGQRKGMCVTSVKGRSSTIKPVGLLRKSKAKQPKLMNFIFERRNLSSTKSLPQQSQEDEDDSDVEIIEESCDPAVEKDVEAKSIVSFAADFAEERLVSDDSGKKTEEYDNSLSQVSHDSALTSMGYVSDDNVEEEDCELEDMILSKNLQVDWHQILENLPKAKKKFDNHWNSNGKNGRRFRAKITPDDNSTAENELKKQLTKEMFKDMSLVGQFNLGFIITKLGSDLFIIDQHAADEKFNYEYLEMTTVLQGQRLIIPMSLQLPAMSENILIENLNIFEKNGFNFNIQENAEPTKRVSLTKIPYSKSCQFGKQDVEELIFLLEDAPEKSFYRPIKVKTMLASRACRKSVMIGDKLSSKEMGRVVGQLAEMEQPWNCPHGRPTLRHLFHLDLMPDVDWFKFEHPDQMGTGKYDPSFTLESPS